MIEAMIIATIVGILILAWGGLEEIYAKYVDNKLKK